MPGIAAGVVTAGEVNQPMQATNPAAMSWGNPGTWAYVWTGAAALYLIGVYLGSIRIVRAR